MNSVEYLEELNHPVNMKAIISKLPFKLQERWRIKAFELQERHCLRAKFADLVAFVSYQSRILSHPLFGSLNHTQARRPGSSQASKPIPSNDRRPKGRYSGFATSVETAKYSNTKQVVSEGANKTQREAIKVCLHCKEDHNLSSCPQLGRRNREEKLEFLKKKGSVFWML